MKKDLTGKKIWQTYCFEVIKYPNSKSEPKVGLYL